MSPGILVITSFWSCTNLNITGSGKGKFLCTMNSGASTASTFRIARRFAYHSDDNSHLLRSPFCPRVSLSNFCCGC